MKLPGLIQFRQCTLSDKQLAEAVASGLNEMYKEPVKVPSRHIPARPDEDFDLLVGELVYRFMEKTEHPAPEFEQSKIDATIKVLEDLITYGDLPDDRTQNIKKLLLLYRTSIRVTELLKNGNLNIAIEEVLQYGQVFQQGGANAY